MGLHVLLVSSWGWYTGTHWGEPLTTACACWSCCVSLAFVWFGLEPRALYFFLFFFKKKHQEWFSFPLVCKLPFTFCNACRLHIFKTLAFPGFLSFPFYKQLLKYSSLWRQAGHFSLSPMLDCGALSVFVMEKGLDVYNNVCARARVCVCEMYVCVHKCVCMMCVCMCV